MQTLETFIITDFYDKKRERIPSDYATKNSRSQMDIGN